MLRKISYTYVCHTENVGGLGFFFLLILLPMDQWVKLEMLFLLCKCLYNFGASKRNKSHTKSFVKWHPWRSFGSDSSSFCLLHVWGNSHLGICREAFEKAKSGLNATYLLGNMQYLLLTVFPFALEPCSVTLHKADMTDGLSQVK